jgi:hypothetical protein
MSSPELERSTEGISKRQPEHAPDGPIAKVAHRWMVDTPTGSPSPPVVSILTRQDAMGSGHPRQHADD